MAFTKQVSDARASSIRNISGTCTDSAEFLQRLNDVSRMLLKRGGWVGSEILARFCIHNCRITYPNWVGTVLGLRFRRGRGVIPINNWAAIVGPYSSCCNFPWASEVTVRDENNAPCYNEITGTTGKYVRYHIVKAQDVGKTITIYGFQYGGQPLQELDSDGNWRMGLTITAASPYAQTTVLITKITSVTREATQGMSYLYEVNPTSGDLIDLAKYEPNETNPSYRRHLIQNVGSVPYYTDANDRRIQTVDALIKLNFIPLVNDNDFLILDDLDALKLGFQAVAASEANDDVLAESKWTLAVRELNFDIRDKNPANQTVIRVNSISSDCILTNPI